MLAQLLAIAIALFAWWPHERPAVVIAEMPADSPWQTAIATSQTDPTDHVCYIFVAAWFWTDYAYLQVPSLAHEYAHCLTGQYGSAPHALHEPSVVSPAYTTDGVTDLDRVFLEGYWRRQAPEMHPQTVAFVVRE